MIMLYLAAIVVANLTTAHFGPAASIVNSFLFIGLDLTTRDALHERWQGRTLWPRMGGLILVGSVLSWVLNRNAGPVAIASLVAFAGAAAADALVYHLLRDRAKMLKVNGSNVVSALVDSLVFPTVAFGGFLWPIVLGQFAAKVIGGFLWSLVLKRTMWAPRAKEMSPQ